MDYLLLVVSASEGITQRTEEFLNFGNYKLLTFLAYNMQIPIITIITKIDLINEEQKKLFIKEFKSTVLKLKIERVPIVMKNNDDVVLFSRNIQEKNLMLTFLVSNLQWEGLNLFKNFLSMLSVNNKLEDELKEIEMEKMEFDVHETIQMGTQYILVGIVSKGKVKAGSKCFLGPDQEGNFRVVEIVNIHCKKIDVAYTNKGQYCSICIKGLNGLNKEDAKKGMVLLDIRSHPVSSRVFEVELWTIDGSRRIIKNTYQPILNIKHIRQCVKIKKYNDIFLFLNEDNEEKSDLEKLVEKEGIDLFNVRNEIEGIKIKKIEENKKFLDKKKCFSSQEANNEEFVISSTTKTKLILEFMFNPEYITVGSNVIINDQSLKAFGVITKIFK